VNLLKPRTPKPRRSVEENYLPACLSLTCSRAAGNADTVDRLKGSFSQYTSVHSDADWGNYSSSAYSLYAPVNRWLKTEHQRSHSFFLFAGRLRKGPRGASTGYSHLSSGVGHDNGHGLRLTTGIFLSLVY